MKKALIIVAVAVAALLGTATPALAHNVLVSSDPATGAAVETGPSTITLIFDAPVQPGVSNQIAVTGPGSTSWVSDPVQVKSNVATVAVRPLGPAGEYIIGYRILSADGHPVSAELRFTLTKAGGGNPVATNPATTSSVDNHPGAPSRGVPIWVWIVGAVLVLGVGLTLALRIGRGGK